MNKSPNQLNSQLVRLTKNSGRRCAKRKSTFLRFCQTTQTIFKMFPITWNDSCQLSATGPYYDQPACPVCNWNKAHPGYQLCHVIALNWKETLSKINKQTKNSDSWKIENGEKHCSQSSSRSRPRPHPRLRAII